MLQSISLVTNLPRKNKVHDSRGQSSVWTLDNCGYLHGALPPKTAKTGRKKHRNVSELHMLPQTS